MADTIVKEIITVLTIKQSQEAIERLKRVRLAADEYKKKMLEIQKTTKEAFSDISKSIFDSTLLQQGSEDARGLQLATRELNQEAKSGSSIWGKFGKTLQSVFVGMIGFRIFQILQEFIGQLVEATEKAVEFNAQQVRLLNTIRSLQRSGLDTTVSEWNNVIKELSETFSQLSTQDITVATEEILKLGRQVGLTDDEMRRLLTSTATLATVTGMDVAKAMDAITDAVKSGRTTDTLRELVGPMQKTTLNAEAQARGVVKAGEAVSDYDRALTLLLLTEKEAVAVSEDLGIIYDSMSGQITKASKATEEYWVAIGEKLLPIKLAWSYFVVAVVSGLNDILELSRTFAAIFGSSVVAPLLLFSEVLSGNVKSLNELKSAYFEIRGELLGTFLNYGKVLPDDAAIGNPQAAQDAADELISIAEETTQELDDIYKDYQQDRKDAETDLYRDLAKIDRDGEEKRAEIIRKNADKIADIHRKAADNVAKENRSYQDDLADLARDTQQKLEDAQRDYREKELQAEIDFNAKLKKLREEFLFNLEDAVRERDARQILRLIRDFELKKSQLMEESQAEKAQRARDYQQELEDIRIQADQKKRELAIEHSRRLQDIKIQTARELREQKIAYAQDMRELKISLAEQRKERRLQFEEQMKDLEEQTAVRLKEVITGMLEEAKATGQGADAIYRALKARLGPGGSVESLYRYYVSMLRATVTQSNAAFAQLASTAAATASLTNIISKPASITKAYPFAEGGTLIANKPTLALFGENGPEQVSFNPIGRIGANENRVFGGSLPSSGASNSSLQLELFLSPDLEARIVDNSLNEFANVMVSVERMRA